REGRPWATALLPEPAPVEGELPRLAARAAGGALAYVDASYRRRPAHLRPPETYAPAGFLQLDAATRRNLELLQTLGGERRGAQRRAAGRGARRRGPRPRRGSARGPRRRAGRAARRARRRARPAPRSRRRGRRHARRRAPAAHAPPRLHPPGARPGGGRAARDGARRPGLARALRGVGAP